MTPSVAWSNFWEILGKTRETWKSCDDFVFQYNHELNDVRYELPISRIYAEDTEAMSDYSEEGCHDCMMEDICDSD